MFGLLPKVAINFKTVGQGPEKYPFKELLSDSFGSCITLSIVPPGKKGRRLWGDGEQRWSKLG